MSYIHKMNIAALDLNLLVALDALLQEESVSRGGKKIGLSQPAMSHALGKLRDLLDDPLLVRTGGRMQLTLRAQSMRHPVRDALERVREVFISDTFVLLPALEHSTYSCPTIQVICFFLRYRRRFSGRRPVSASRSIPGGGLPRIPWAMDGLRMPWSPAKSVTCQAFTGNAYSRTATYA
jgi:DNA-binding transcriptional LysR family regulator